MKNFVANIFYSFGWQESRRTLSSCLDKSSNLILRKLSDHLNSMTAKRDIISEYSIFFLKILKLQSVWSTHGSHFRKEEDSISKKILCCPHTGKATIRKRKPLHFFLNASRRKCYFHFDTL
jgi:hypothetical protein